MMNPDVSMRPTILLLREGTDTSQVRGKDDCLLWYHAFSVGRPTPAQRQLAAPLWLHVHAAVCRLCQGVNVMHTRMLCCGVARARARLVPGLRDVGKWLAVGIVPPPSIPRAWQLMLASRHSPQAGDALCILTLLLTHACLCASNVQGKGQLISNINACQAVAEAVRTTLGPRGMDKLIHDGTKVRACVSSAVQCSAAHTWSSCVNAACLCTRCAACAECTVLRLRAPHYNHVQATISNDGAKILQLLDIVHPAAKTLVDIARAQDAEIGDGTTTVTLLAAEFMNMAKTFVEDGVHPQIIVRVRCVIHALRMIAHACAQLYVHTQILRHTVHTSKCRVTDVPACWLWTKSAPLLWV